MTTFMIAVISGILYFLGTSRIGYGKMCIRDRSTAATYFLGFKADDPLLQKQV